MQILIVGGLGMVGSMLANELSRAVNKVFIYDKGLYANLDILTDLNVTFDIISTEDIADFPIGNMDCVVWSATIDDPIIYKGENPFLNKLITDQYDLFKYVYERSNRFINLSSYRCCKKENRKEDLDYHTAGEFYKLENLLDGNKSMSLRIPELHGPSIRTRFDIIVHKIFKSFKEQNAVLIEENWVEKIPFMSVYDLVTGLKEMIVKRIYIKDKMLCYNESFTILEVAQIIKSYLKTDDGLIITPRYENSHTEYNFGEREPKMIQPMIKSIEILNNQITKNAFSDWANDIYNNRIVLSWLEKLHETFKRLE